MKMGWSNETLREPWGIQKDGYCKLIRDSTHFFLKVGERLLRMWIQI